VEAAPKALAGKSLLQQLGNSFLLAPVPQAAQYQPYVRHIGYWIADLAEKVGPAVLVDCDMIPVGQPSPASRRQQAMDSEGNPAQCFTRLNRSSSAAATSAPLRMSAAEESPWNALSPSMIIAPVFQALLLRAQACYHNGRG